MLLERQNFVLGSARLGKTFFVFFFGAHMFAYADSNYKSTPLPAKKMPGHSLDIYSKY